jgi:hypothetical protein
MSIQFLSDLNNIPPLLLTADVQKVARKLERITVTKESFVGPRWPGETLWMLISALMMVTTFDAPARSAVTNNAEIPIPSHIPRNIIIDCMVRRGEK